MDEERSESLAARIFKLIMEGKVGNGIVIERIQSKLNTIGPLFPIFRMQAQTAPQTPKIEQPKQQATEPSKPQKERPYGAPIKTYG
jgi:hypothetical protein